MAHLSWIHLSYWNWARLMKNLTNLSCLAGCLRMNWTRSYCYCYWMMSLYRKRLSSNQLIDMYTQPGQSLMIESLNSMKNLMSLMTKKMMTKMTTNLTNSMNWNCCYWKNLKKMNLNLTKKKTRKMTS